MNPTQTILDIEHFSRLTPIQQAVVDRKDPQRDFIGISSTGSGKSHAFFLAIFNRINPEEDRVQAVISTPTRELAYQLNERIKKLARTFGVRVALCTGGMERREFSRQPQIVIGTPGRLKDLFLQEKTLLLNQARLFIIDEADMTLEFGFLEDIDEILSHMSSETTIMVFSATIPQQLQPFLKKYLSNPELVSINTDQDFSANIRHILIDLKHKSDLEGLLELLPAINPYVCLIFANTTQQAAATAKALRNEGYDLVELHSGMEARERQKAIRQIQSQKKSYIVASDLASRGIDLDGITHVISLGFPRELQFYTHRAGRTGRAGRDGVSIALVNNRDQKAIDSLRRSGIAFESMEVKKGQLVQTPKRKTSHRQSDELKAEIQKLSKKKKKVKPNYRKKRAQQIETIKRKQKRAFIKKEIQAQKKERAKARQREKNR